MNIAEPMLASDQITGLDRIRWGPYDDHLITEDEDPKAEATAWYVGTRDEELWQLRVIWPSPAKVNWTPGDAQAEINLSVWRPGPSRFHDTVWSAAIWLDEHELDQINRMQFDDPDVDEAYALLRNKALGLAQRFIEDPYAALMEVHL